MKNETTLSRTFWSGVINYVRASAQTAEALKPWDFREEKIVKTVLVFRTSVDGFADQVIVAGQLDELVGQNNWTIDLDDVDKVLRIVCEERMTGRIIAVLNGHDFSCELMT
ncbi:MAG TPA: hypothetical protein VGC08_16065 [Pedobacter sp.]|jgi:hypothetical protein